MPVKSQRRERLRRQSGTSSTVTRAFAILNTLSLKGASGLSLLEMSSTLHMSRSTTHRYLVTLEKLGAVERDGYARFHLGLKLLELAGRTLETSDLRKQADPFLTELAGVTLETVHLAVPSGTEVVYIAKADSPNAIRMYSSIGAKAPMYCTALGKAILAYSPAELVQQVVRTGLGARTPFTLRSRQALEGELERVRAEGFALDSQENEAGVCCVGAPIFDYRSRPVGAISVSGPADRMSRHRLLELGPQVKKTAMRISRRMGYSDTS